MSHHEPIRGLPGPLPEGERVLWQGQPDWRALALRVFHIRALTVALLAFAVWTSAAAVATRLPPAIAVLVGLGPLIPGGFLLALVAATAWVNARVSIYTITSARVMMRVGLVFPIILNVPFRELKDVSIRDYPDGAGDIPLGPGAGQRLGYFMLWPHVRPWRTARAEPMLRAVPQAREVAAILVRAMQASTLEPGWAAAAAPATMAPAARPAARSLQAEPAHAGSRLQEGAPA